MLRRAPTLLFCAVMSGLLGAGMPEVVLLVSVPVSLGAGAVTWRGSRRNEVNTAGA